MATRARSRPLREDSNTTLEFEADEIRNTESAKRHAGGFRILMIVLQPCRLAKYCSLFHRSQRPADDGKALCSWHIRIVDATRHEGLRLRWNWARRAQEDIACSMERPLGQAHSRNKTS